MLCNLGRTLSEQNDSSNRYWLQSFTKHLTDRKNDGSITVYAQEKDVMINGLFNDLIKVTMFYHRDVKKKCVAI